MNLKDISTEDILHLSELERRNLIERIENTLESHDDAPLSDEERKMLDELLAERDANPGAGQPWRDVMREIGDKWLNR